MEKKYKKLNWSKERKELFNRMSDWLEEIRKGEKTGFVWSMEQLLVFIEQEIDRAREEGYTKGVQDGMKGKVFEKIEIDTEVRFSDLKDVIDGKEDAGEFLDKLTK